MMQHLDLPTTNPKENINYIYVDPFFHVINNDINYDKTMGKTMNYETTTIHHIIVPFSVSQILRNVGTEEVQPVAELSNRSKKTIFGMMDPCHH